MTQLAQPDQGETDSVVERPLPVWHKEELGPEAVKDVVSRLAQLELIMRVSDMPDKAIAATPHNATQVRHARELLAKLRKTGRESIRWRFVTAQMPGSVTHRLQRELLFYDRSGGINLRRDTEIAVWLLFEADSDERKLYYEQHGLSGQIEQMDVATEYVIEQVILPRLRAGNRFVDAINEGAMTAGFYCDDLSRQG